MGASAGRLETAGAKTASPLPPRDAENLRSQVATLRWFHRIDLGNGIVTPGENDKDHQDWVTSALPQRMDGLSVLDIGAWDGYFSFLAEERGARRVLAIDSLQNEETHRSGRRPFELAKEVRRSGVEYRVLDVRDLDRLDESFDVVLFLGVYYHLPDPWKALEAIRRKVNPGGRVYLEGLLLAGDRPLVRFFQPSEVEETTYCAATELGLTTLARLAGFATVRTLARRRGLGNLPFALWRFVPHNMRPGEGLRPRTASASILHSVRRLGLTRPRIIQELRVS